MTLLVVVLFAMVGAVAGPSWSPERVTTSIVPETADTSVLGSSPETTLGRYATATEQVELDLAEGVTTPVLIVSPLRAPSPGPAVVFLHGAGTGLPEGFAEQAQALASAGVVAVVPGKRLDNYSDTHRDYLSMAQDYAKAVALARSLDTVDPDRVALYAESEGTWIAAVLGAQDPVLSGIALVSAPVVPPREQAAFAVDSYLSNVGVPHSLLRAIPRATGARLPAGIMAYADFDATPYYEQLQQPLLMAYGTADHSMPIVQGPQIVAGAVPGGFDQLMLRYYDGANHGIRIGDGDDPVLPEFLAGVAAWAQNPAGAVAAGPFAAGAQPVQIHRASAVPQPRWYADGQMLFQVPIVAAGILLGGYLALALAGLAGYTLRRRAARERAAGSDGVVAGGVAAGVDGVAAGIDGVAAGAGEPATATATVAPLPENLARRVVSFSLATWLLLVLLLAYIAAVAQLALSYSTNGVTVWGGWALVQLWAVICALLGVLAVRALGGVALARWRERRAAHEAGTARVRPTRGVGTAVVVVRETALWLVIAGTAVLLFVAAYWGAFSPIS